MFKTRVGTHSTWKTEARRQLRREIKSSLQLQYATPAAQTTVGRVPSLGMSGRTIPFRYCLHRACTAWGQFHELYTRPYRRSWQRLLVQELWRHPAQQRLLCPSTQERARQSSAASYTPWQSARRRRSNADNNNITWLKLFIPRQTLHKYPDKHCRRKVKPQRLHLAFILDSVPIKAPNQ